MTLIWHGDKIDRRIRLWTRDRVREAVLAVEKIAKSSMKRGGRTETGEVSIVEFTTKAGKTKKRTIDPSTGKRVGKIGRFHSKPGEVPRAQTGRLRRSITSEMHSVLPIGRVGTNLSYGRDLEMGTKPHIIRVKSKRVLANERLGQIFGKKVKHPGIKPRPWLRPALHKARPIILGFFRKPLLGGGAKL